MKKMLLLAVVWVASMFVAGVWGYAQTPTPQPAPRSPGTSAPTVISGPDLGFRVDRYKGNTPLGRFVVRIDGHWVEIEESVGVRRLSSR